MLKAYRRISGKNYKKAVEEHLKNEKTRIAKINALERELLEKGKLGKRDVSKVYKLIPEIVDGEENDMEKILEKYKNKEITERQYQKLMKQVYAHLKNRLGDIENILKDLAIACFLIIGFSLVILSIMQPSITGYTVGIKKVDMNVMMFSILLLAIGVLLFAKFKRK